MKLSPRMRTYYVIIVVLIVLFSVGTMAAVLPLLEHWGLSTPGKWTVATLFIVSGAFSGMLSCYLGKRILTPMVKLSEASKEVARGNFGVTVSDPSRLEEVQTTFRNFNAMVRELGSSAALSSDFVANVSHEFKTPLTAIEGYAMLLQDAALPESERGEYLSKILFNTQRLSELMSNILLLSKLENQSLSTTCESVRLDEQIRRCVVTLEPAWSARELHFDVRLDEVSLRGCAELLALVWSNLIGNAVKFSPQGGEIELRLFEQTECVVFSIRDHGCGMTEEARERCFEKFYQGDTSHRAEGNGLGLAMVKRVVELAQGVIEVESAPGKGAAFRVILPK